MGQKEIQEDKQMYLNSQQKDLALSSITQVCSLVKSLVIN